MADNQAGSLPQSFFSYRAFAYIKLKTDPVDQDGTISAVHFFAGTNLIGTVTNPPYNLLWILPPGRWDVRAVAVDEDGLESEAQAGTFIGLSGRPPESYVEIVWPRNGTMFATPATFEFAAELMVGAGEVGPIEFRVNDSSIGVSGSGGLLAATTPASVIAVSNLVEGHHTLGIRYLGSPECWRCSAVTNIIRVVRLGVHSPRVSPDGARQFEVATSYSGKWHVIEVSDDLLNWCVLGTTNAPMTNSFTFVVPGPAPAEHRYYRVLVPEP